MTSNNNSGSSSSYGRGDDDGADNNTQNNFQNGDVEPTVLTVDDRLMVNTGVDLDDDDTEDSNVIKNNTTSRISLSSSGSSVNDDENNNGGGSNAPEPRPLLCVKGRLRLVIVLLLTIAVAVIVTVVFVMSSAGSNKNGSNNSNINNNDSLSSSSFFNSHSGDSGDDRPTQIDEATTTSDPTSTPSSTPTSSPTSTPSSTPTTSQPSSSPTSSSPSASPTTSSVPSSNPTSPPSTSKSPSASPTDNPTMTMAPTSVPTSSYVDPNPVPSDPQRGYFNYDIDDWEYGPLAWEDIDTSDHPLREFGPDGWGAFDGHNSYRPRWNFCGRTRDYPQSPKNMVGTPNVECEAYHEIRTWCGWYSLLNEELVPQILPHKLSLQMNRRPCLNIGNSNCAERGPPRADLPIFANDGTQFSDLLNYDIKIPGEHSIEGESFDAEIQMLHTHPVERNKMSSLAVMVRARDNDSFHNIEYQHILDQFQRVYDRHADECSTRRNETRTLSSTTTTTESNNQNNNRNLRTAMMMGEEEQEDVAEITLEASAATATTARRLQESTTAPPLASDRFDPYSAALMPNIFFYRYDGTITEPPCMDVTWWVMASPMIISSAQLQQTKRLLFTHIDEDCNPTSVHNADQSVARPLFPLTDRDMDNMDDGGIQDCIGSFTTDVSKGRGEGRKCRATGTSP